MTPSLASMPLPPMATVSSLQKTAQSAMKTRAESKLDAKLDASAEDFVAVFMAQMIQPMFEGVGVNDLFGGGHGEDAMRTFLVQEYGKAVAKTDKSGLADAVKAELLRLQEGKSGSIDTPQTGDEG